MKLFNRRKSHHHSYQSDEMPQTIESALESNARQIRSEDAETAAQWQRLHISIKTKRIAAQTNTVAAIRTIGKPTIAFALAVMVLLLVGSVWIFQSSAKTFTTTKAQHSAISLSDGTEVTLNHTSELIVRRSLFDKARRVSLNGEALFHVQKNGTPFIITTEVGTVQVLGTQFNVRMRHGIMEVAVLNGSVKITARKNGIDSSVVLANNQIAICARDEFPEAPKTLPYVFYPGWISGKFIFYRSNIADACKELESQFDVIIKIQNLQRHTETITGILDGKTIENALTSLRQLTGITYHYENGAYIID